MSYNREYKSSVFAMLYEDKENLLDLYNGVNGKSLTNADDITVNTLTDKDGVESGIFMKVKNDVSFIFDSYLRKHHIDFSTAAKALETGEIIYDFYDEASSAEAGEDRYIAIVAVGAFLMIVYTMRESETVTRIISARKLEEKEVKRL